MCFLVLHQGVRTLRHVIFFLEHTFYSSRLSVPLPNHVKTTLPPQMPLLYGMMVGGGFVTLLLTGTESTA